MGPTRERPRQDAAAGIDREGATPHAVASRASEHVLEDAEFGTLFKTGALWGIPTLFAILVGVCALAVPGNGLLLAAMVWPALFAGGYFGGIVALTVLELHQESADRQRRPEPVRRTEHLRVRRRSVTAH